MFVFKILLILLIAAPVIAIATYFYFQMLAYIRDRNKVEEYRMKKEAAGMAVRSDAEKRGDGRRKKSGKRK